MKKIINGRRYDTDSAKKLAEWETMRGNFSYICETLYRKSTGEYFIHGEGGPASKYAETIGLNQWSGGERIMPLTVQEAQEWAEEHLDGDDYEEIFGAVDESGEKKTCAFSLTEGTIKKIADLASEWSCSKSEVIERLVK